MANVTVRNLPDAVHRALRARAATHGRSTEAEIRYILEAVAEFRGKDADTPVVVITPRSAT